MPACRSAFPRLLPVKYAFTVLQVIPRVCHRFALVVSGPGYIAVSLVLWCSITYYSLSVTVFLTGLSPNVLVYDVKVLFSFMVLVGVPVMVCIGLALINPGYAVFAALLAIPAWVFVHSGYKRWEGKDVGAF